MISVIRDQALLAVEELTPPTASFVLTNCLIEGNIRDHAAYAKTESLAARRQSTFVPVVLRASDAAYAARIPSADRVEGLKHTHVASAAEKRQTSELLRIAHPHRLDLDTSDLAPAEAARKIIAHAESLA